MGFQPILLGLGNGSFLSFQVATSSGDSTIKIWDVAKEKCKHTLTDHTQLAAQILNPLAFKASISLILFCNHCQKYPRPVWACSFHDLGDFVVSCSMVEAQVLPVFLVLFSFVASLSIFTSFA